jgi:hypothetical protein
MHGQYVGFDAWDNEIAASFSEGYHFKPRLQFLATDLVNPFDPKTGERRGIWRPVDRLIVHDLFIPEDPKQRRKFLEKLVKDMDVSNCTFSYRRANPDNNHSSIHSDIGFNNICDLNVTQLQELSEKAYYKDSSGNLYDKDGYIVR